MHSKAWNVFQLLLPAIIPSWRFFDAIGPSPRIEFRLLQLKDDNADIWQEFRPRPSYLSFGTLLRRLVFNPRWNETLFLVSCAERLSDNPQEQGNPEILQRLKRGLEQGSVDLAATPYIQYRLAFLSRQGDQLQKDITFISPIHQLAEGGTS